MLWKRWAVAALAVLAICIGTSATRAGDVIRLGLNVSAPTVTLDLNADKDADTQEAFWRGGYGTGYRGYYGSYYGGYRGYSSAYYGGYSSYYPRYSSSYYSYRPSYYYTPSYYAPRYYGGYSSYYYQPSYYYRQPVYSYYSPYYCPISLNVNPGSAGSLPGGSYQQVVPMDPLPPNQPSQPLPNNPSGDGTFPYNGGPSSPVPMPKNDAAPETVPNKGFVPGEGRLVSLPTATPAPKYNYPAYGDNKKVPSKTEPAAKALR